MKRDDFKFDITFAFVIFAFLIIVVVTYSAVYIFSNFTTKEFKDKIKLIANTTYQIYKKKENTVISTTISLVNNDLFNNNFNLNPLILKSFFKTMLFANSDISEISFYNSFGKGVISCEKIENEIICKNIHKNLLVKNFEANTLLKKEFLSKKGIVFLTISPLKFTKKGFIEIKSIFKYPKNENFNFYHFLVIDNKGKIFYSTFYNVNSIFDLFNYLLANKILKIKKGFVSNDIYVEKFSNHIKFIYIQNKSVITKTNKASQKLAIFMIVISIFIAIPLGIFFSRPLYSFYQELDKKVKEEVEKRREKEQILMHQSKLAALGEMLGNIAHQWRHPLTRLSLLIQNLEMAYNMNKLTKEKFEKFKNDAMHQINYMSTTIDDFTNFFKKDTKKVEFCPKDIIEDALKLIEARINQNRVNVKLEFKELKPIYGYKTEFSQVILNLLNNAIDVLKERNIQNKEIIIRVDDKKIEIEDNAGGVEDKIKDKIFEPYFTTKFQSQGTGIGLYMSKIIINQHFNGKLYFYNSNKGAVFVIEL